MGAYLSYVYSFPSPHCEKESEKVDGVLRPHKFSDPSYTIQYPPQEEEFLRKVEEEDEKKKEAKESNQRIPEDVWSRMSHSEKQKYFEKERYKKYKHKKKANAKQIAQQNQRDQLRPWLETLTPQQKAAIKQVTIRPPKDPLLLAYLHRDDIVQCPNKYCGVFFERSGVRGGAAFVLREDGKPLDGESLEHFLDFRFKCHHCATNFCVECSAIPYHIGENCDQYKQRTSRPPCRVCKKPLPVPPDNASSERVCFGEDCRNLVANECTLKASCGHPCNGNKNQTCLCLRASCIASFDITQTGDQFCSICWTDELESGTCIRLNCGHVFHRHCVFQRLSHRWTGARISFNFVACPLCQKAMDYNLNGDYGIFQLLRNINELQQEVKFKALHFLKVEGMMHEVSDHKHKYFDKPFEYAMDTFSFYMCSKCSTPYYGGRRQCGDILNFNPDELVCGGCSGQAKCEKHGKKYITYKCRFCCSIASWFCFGLVHYCENCHSDPYKYWASNNTLLSVPPQCLGKTKCPLGVDHPPNGFEEMSLGCSACKLEEAGMVMENEEGEEEEDYDF